MTKSMCKRLAAGVAAWIIGTACTAPLALAQGTSSQPVADADSATSIGLKEWSGEVWGAADGGDEKELLAKLEAIANSNTEGADWIRDSVEKFKENIAKREAQRAEQIEKASKELDEHLANGTKPSELSEALRIANELELLMPDRDAFFAEPRISQLITTSEQVARQAEKDENWLVASELLARLDLLYENQEKYKDELDAINERLVMIRTYAPEKFWKMRNDERIAAGEDPLPDYNPVGDRWEDKLADVRIQTVLQAISRTYGHVDGIPMKTIIVDGLKSLQTLATTPELRGEFTGLTDAAKRDQFVKAIGNLRKQIEAKDGIVTRSDLYSTIESLLQANSTSVNIPINVLAHEFGNGAMSALDPYSAIIWPDELARFERSTRGEFVGVGISIQMDEEQNIKIVTPLEGSPAQRAGIRADDIIKQVDGKSTVGFSLDQAVEVITGPRNTKVVLTIERMDENDKPVTLDFPIVRQVIDLPTVKGWEKVGAGDDDWNWFVDPEAGIGYIRLTGFSEKTTDEFDRAVRAMKAQGLNGLVLDLRFNPGGLLDQAVNIASRFIDSGMIVRTEDATGRTRDEEDARTVASSVDLSDLPVIVLINEGSASASEIVSGSIQAHAKEGKMQALIVGHRSFGKGSVQNVFPIPGDSSTLMKLTTQYYKLRGNHTIHRRPGETEWGIRPDLAIEMLPQQSMDALLLRRDADVLPLDENGEIIADAERPDPNRLLSEGMDLQLEAAVVLLESQEAPEIVAKVSRSGG